MWRVNIIKEITNTNKASDSSPHFVFYKSVISARDCVDISVRFLKHKLHCKFF